MKVIKVDINDTLIGALESVPLGLVMLAVTAGKAEPLPVGLLCHAAAAELAETTKLLAQAKDKLKALEQQTLVV